MDTTLLAPDGPSRIKQVQDAKDMFDTIKRNAERAGSAVPPYEFIELIGKGAFGRVYKCRHTETGQLAAVKILNIDDADFQADRRERDETVKDFRKEVEILTQLKDFKAKNVNMIHDAFDLHSQLWIVSDFCTGGSVRTLMRANPRRGLEDKFIIPIARELAIALKSVHDIGVIHRDLKCANVYVTEDGRIQLGDFGVVGVMDNGIAKRTTIIGTPWYMPREMHVDTFSVTQGYGKEVDIWAYGCTVFEMATGYAPNATVAQHMLGTVLEHDAPRLVGDEYSDDLRDFVASVSPVIQPLDRPQINYLNTLTLLSLVALIDRYVVWEHKGGQRTSLFNPGGAAAPIRADENEDEPATETDDWNFNTSDSFYGGFAKRYSRMHTNEDLGHEFEAPPGAGLPPIRARDMTPLERIQQEHAAKSANRGERSLNRIWNQDAAPYDLDDLVPTIEPANDLPLREYSSGSTARESTVIIDLDTTPSDDNGPNFNFDFDNIPTVKAKQRGSTVEDEEESQPLYNQPSDDKRSTLAWTFPSVETAPLKRQTMEWTWPGEPSTAPLDADPSINKNDNGDLPSRPQLKHTATAPLGQMGDFIHSGQTYVDSSSSPARGSLHSLIDLNLDSSDPTEITRPSTAISHTGSTSTIMTSGPFDLDDRGDTRGDEQLRYSFHKPWLSEGGNGDRHGPDARHQRGHSGNSLSSADSDLARGRREFYHDDYPSDLEIDTYSERMSGANSVARAASDNGSTWDMVEDDEIEYSTPATPALEEFTFPLNTGLASGEVAGMPGAPHRQGSDGLVSEAVDFPTPQPADPAALLERADDQMVMLELRRLLRDAGHALKSTADAIARHTEMDYAVDQAAMGANGHHTNGV